MIAGPRRISCSPETRSEKDRSQVALFANSDLFLITLHTKQPTCQFWSRAFIARSVMGFLHAAHFSQAISMKHDLQKGCPSLSWKPCEKKLALGVFISFYGQCNDCSLTSSFPNSLLHLWQRKHEECQDLSRALTQSCKWTVVISVRLSQKKTHLPFG